uniref:Uncharacterized protein n=1 Tax=Setaria italica TaxID=4555 RepID=K3ZAP6_SETIT
MGISGRVLAWRFVCMGSSERILLTSRSGSRGTGHLVSTRPCARKKKATPPPAAVATTPPVRGPPPKATDRGTPFSLGTTPATIKVAPTDPIPGTTPASGPFEKSRRELGNFEKLKWILKEEEFEEAQIALKDH